MIKEKDIKKKVKDYRLPLHNLKNLVLDPKEDEKVVPDFLKKSWKN